MSGKSNSAPCVWAPSAWHRRGLCLVVALAMVAGLSGCSTMLGALFAARLPECKGFDVPLSAFVGPSRKELRVRVRARMVDHVFQFVAETKADSFVLVAFTPLGTKAFTLVRSGVNVEETNLLAPVSLPVPPRNVMEDVLAMSVPSSCATSPESEVLAQWNGWDIRDTCHDSRPAQRHISRPGKPSEVEIEYGLDGITVRQQRCRYSARYVLQQAPPALPAAVVVAPVVVPPAPPVIAPATAPTATPVIAPAATPVVAPAAAVPAPVGQPVK